MLTCQLCLIISTINNSNIKFIRLFKPKLKNNNSQLKNPNFENKNRIKRRRGPEQSHPGRPYKKRPRSFWREVCRRRRLHRRLRGAWVRFQRTSRREPSRRLSSRLGEPAERLWMCAGSTRMGRATAMVGSSWWWWCGGGGRCGAVGRVCEMWVEGKVTRMWSGWVGLRVWHPFFFFWFRGEMKGWV